MRNLGGGQLSINNQQRMKNLPLIEGSLYKRLEVRKIAAFLFIVLGIIITFVLFLFMNLTYVLCMLEGGCIGLLFYIAVVVGRRESK
ncbi:hypothetical protein [Niallia nealsonii]|uniref:Uncharacterized protein n=1 Tax=Niallia nealsonii TaxID=115979 RepID=A0A2N0YZM1_9BACI|nr:hypothetical protein [Niallia nealsonii]PKG22704.1 hypothetical protein CWS01_15815 [Niallia nealsonii]